MNRLKDATSPYLLQHADNPVDWWEWGTEPFEEARRLREALPPEALLARLGEDQFLLLQPGVDDDAGARKAMSAESDAGWLAAGRVYSWRTAELQLSVIGAAEYDAQIRVHRALLFARGVPGVLCWDWGTRPERAGMFTFDGNAWKFATQKIYRSGVIPLREHYPRTTY